MKSKYALFVVAALLSAPLMGAKDGVQPKPAAHAPRQFAAQKKVDATVADVVKKILRKSARAPWDMLSGFLLFKVGADVYGNLLQQYGHHITEAQLVKRFENAFPRGYGQGLAPWAMHAMVGYCAVATVRELLLKSMPEILGARKAFDKLTEAARQD